MTWERLNLLFVLLLPLCTLQKHFFLIIPTLFSFLFHNLGEVIMRIVSVFLELSTIASSVNVELIEVYVPWEQKS